MPWEIEMNIELDAKPNSRKDNSIFGCKKLEICEIRGKIVKNGVWASLKICCKNRDFFQEFKKLKFQYESMGSLKNVHLFADTHATPTIN